MNSTEKGQLPMKNSFFANSSFSQKNNWFKKDKEITIEEKKYLISVERGDIATVKQYLDSSHSAEDFNLNVQDSLGRNALYIAIEYENIDMIEVLINYHIELGESILHAINEEFVEAVEMLLSYQDRQNSLLDLMASNELNDSKTKIQPVKNLNFELNSWNLIFLILTLYLKSIAQESDIPPSKSFTPDITPIILASHKDNYEIIKILLDRGELIMEPVNNLIFGR